MKRPLTMLIASLFTLAGYSQHINYQKSFEQALSKAKAEHKPLFINIYSSIKTPNTDGKKDIRKSGLDAPEVVKLYDKDFINYQVSASDSASSALRKTYKLSLLPAYLFLNENGELLYKTFGNSTIPSKYTAMRAKVMAMLSSGRNLPAYDSKYKEGLRSAEFLRDYILLREELGFTDNAELIDAYVDNLTVKSLNNYNEVLFILKAGPYAYGKAYNLMYLNKKIVDSIFKKEPVAVRAIIDLRIIDNTMQKAIREKSIETAQQATRCLTASMFRTDYRKGAIASTRKMLQYYQGVNDTANYFKQSVYLYDTYYMNISADSARKIDQRNIQNLEKYVFTSPKKTDTIKTAVVQPMVKQNNMPLTLSSAIVALNTTATTLNNAAYTFYTLGTHNQNYLTRAMLWSKRAIELSPKAAYYDTLAHLLYRIGFYDEAASAQSQAVSLAQKTNGTIDHYKTELNKIKKREL